MLTSLIISIVKKGYSIQFYGEPYDQNLTVKMRREKDNLANASKISVSDLNEAVNPDVFLDVMLKRMEKDFEEFDKRNME